MTNTIRMFHNNISFDLTSINIARLQYVKYPVLIVGIDVFLSNIGSDCILVTYDNENVIKSIDGMEIFHTAPMSMCYRGLRVKNKDIYGKNPECYHPCYLFFDDEKDYIKWKLKS